MSKRIVGFEYKITEDGSFQDKEFGHTKELNNQFDSLFRECNDKNNFKIIDKLKVLINKFPKSPILKNYLCKAYITHKMTDEAVNINEKILIEHPNYLFGKINKANDLIYKGEAEKVPSVLGELLDLKALYPDRELFHKSEVLNYLYVVARYFLAIGDSELADNRVEIIKKIDPKCPFIQEVENEKQFYKAQTLNKNKSEQAKAAARSQSKKQPITMPKLTNTELKILYEYEEDIPAEEIQKILALPRESLINDLENILKDAKDRYQYYYDQELEVAETCFPTHAIFLLTELKSYKSLPKIISFLENEDVFLDFWLKTHLIFSLSRIFLGLGINQYDLMKNVLLNPNSNLSVNLAVYRGLCKIALHNLDQKAVVVATLKEVITIFSQTKDKNNLVIAPQLTFLVNEIIQANLYELLPEIELLFKKNLINEKIFKNVEQIKIALASSIPDSSADFTTIYEFYEACMDSYADDDDLEELYPGEFDELLQRNDEHLDDDNTIVNNKPNLGRNDPCYCGSGKKFKKCHG
jgi:hypothetical protein